MFKRTQLSVGIAACISVQAALADDTAERREFLAQMEDGVFWEEIIVTARRREEILQTVPVGVDVVTSKEIEEKAINTLDDVARNVSGLDFRTGLLMSDTRVTIRGLTSTRGRSNVAITVDGVDLSTESMSTAGSGTGLNLGLMDLERVEVVKGPQSALYGRSAFAGAVNYVTKRPSHNGEGRVMVDGNDQGYQNTRVNSNFSIIQDQLAASVALEKTDFDGYYTNPNTGGDLGGIDSKGIATALFWTPSETFDAYWRTEYNESLYSPRAVVQRQAISNMSNPFDFALMGSPGPYAEVLPVPGTGATATDCATAPAYGYLVNPMSPACAAIITGDLGEASESEIDLSPDPLTGLDYPGTEVRNVRSMLELKISDAGFELVSLTGINRNESRAQVDFDRSNFTLESLGPGSGMFVPPGFPGEFTQYGVSANSDTSFDTTQFSQELRIAGKTDRLEWLLSGLYWSESMDTEVNQQWWLREGADKTFWDAFMNYQFFGIPAGVPGPVDHRTSPVPLPIPMERDSDHVSVAFSLNYSLTEDVRLTAEGRYLREDIDYSTVPFSTQLNGLMGIPYIDPVTFRPGVPAREKYARSDSAFVPRVTIDWQPNDTTLLYAMVAEGFKPGGTNTLGGSFSAEAYDPEELTVYEAGIKSQYFDDRLRVNASLYQYDYTQQQIPYFFTNPVTGSLQPGITNAGESALQGLELSAVFKPNANWTLYAAYNLNDSELKDYRVGDVGEPGLLDKLWTGTADGDFSGKQFQDSAENTARMSIRFDGDLLSTGNYFAELSGSYTSERFIDRGNNAYLPEYWMVDFQSGMSFSSADVVLYVNNVLDDDTVKNGLHNVNFGFLPGGRTTPQTIDLFLPEPRTAGVRVAYKF